MKVKEYVNLDNKVLTYYINERTNKVMCYQHTKADEIVSAFSVETFKSLIKRRRLSRSKPLSHISRHFTNAATFGLT